MTAATKRERESRVIRISACSPAVTPRGVLRRWWQCTVCLSVLKAPTAAVLCATSLSKVKQTIYGVLIGHLPFAHWWWANHRGMASYYYLLQWRWFRDVFAHSGHAHMWPNVCWVSLVQKSPTVIPPLLPSKYCHLMQSDVMAIWPII